MKSAADLMVVGQAPEGVDLFGEIALALSPHLKLGAAELRSLLVVNLMTLAGPLKDFPREAAQKAADALTAERPFVLFSGQTVAALCGVRCPYFTWVQWRTAWAAVIPSFKMALDDTNALHQQMAQFFHESREFEPTLKLRKFDGGRLRGLRKERNVSQLRLGILINRDRQTIYRWEAEETEPSASDLLALSVALACDPFDLAR